MQTVQALIREAVWPWSTLFANQQSTLRNNCIKKQNLGKKGMELTHCSLETLEG